MGLLGEEREGRKGSCFLVVELQVFGGQWAALNTRSGENSGRPQKHQDEHGSLHPEFPQGEERQSAGEC